MRQVADGRHGRGQVWKRDGRWWYRVWSVYGYSSSHVCNYSGHVDGDESLAAAADKARFAIEMLDSSGPPIEPPAPLRYKQGAER